MFNKMSCDLMCRGCLALPRKSASALASASDSEAYNSLIGVPLLPAAEMAVHLCSFCSRALHKCAKFKARCLKVREILHQAQVKGEVTNECTDRLTSIYPELRSQYVQTKTLIVEFDSTPITIFKHENRDDITEVPKALYKQEKVSASGTDPDLLDDHLLDDLENPYVELVKTCKVFVKDYNALQNDKVLLKKRKRTVKLKKLKKDSKSDTQIVTDYAESADFDIAFLSRAEQIEEIERRKQETVTNGVKCEKCGKYFQNSDVLQRHDKQYHVLTSNSFMCDICSCVFRNKRALRAHVLGHSWVFTCKSCNFKTKQRAVLRKHQYYHKGKVFRCTFCARVFDKHATYFSHVRLLHAAELPSCDLCGQFFNSQKGVETHKKLSHNVDEEFPNACSICDKKFQSDTALKRHINVKGCNQPSCAQCGDCFITDYLLKHHLVQRHHSKTSPETFDCVHCLSRFYNSPALARHDCDSKALCIQCGDHFDSTQLLAEHFASAHHIFKCEECGKQFTNAMYYKRHYAVRHTERPPTKPPKPKTRKYPVQTIRKWSVVGAGDVCVEGGRGEARGGGAGGRGRVRGVREVCQGWSLF